jgi:hypothetical protein
MIWKTNLIAQQCKFSLFFKPSVSVPSFEAPKGFDRSWRLLVESASQIYPSEHEIVAFGDNSMAKAIISWFHSSISTPIHVSVDSDRALEHDSSRALWRERVGSRRIQNGTARNRDCMVHFNCSRDDEPLPHRAIYGDGLFHGRVHAFAQPPPPPAVPSPPLGPPSW